jgi:Holliday junction resolvase RusA-like endonuclease
VSSISFTLPFLPASKSNGYRTGKGKFFKSSQVVEQEKQIINIIIEALPAEHIMMLGPVKLTACFYYPDNRRRDLDGHLKLLLDCMNGLVFKDDSQVVNINISKILGCQIAYSTVTVEEHLA